MDAELTAWLAENGVDFEVITTADEKTKVRCKLTQHDMLPRLEECEAYRAGKAFSRAKRKHGRLADKQTHSSG
eukprot:SAG31_NODE_781_length_12127_cov_34.178334_14_plen_73_part_00